MNRRQTVILLLAMLWSHVVLAGTSNDIQGEYLYGFIGVILVVFLLWTKISRIIKVIGISFISVCKDLIERFHSIFKSFLAHLPA
jgi:uncharacterized BrkB/YihY/UPF0761 family membrane protein